MQLEHVALWTADLEKTKAFYEKYFLVKSSALYHNTKTGFQSYFLSFDSGARLEITTKKNLGSRVAESLGYSHIAISVGGKNEVDAFAKRFVADGIELISGPRTTGDGYYEAVIKDYDGNLIELTTDFEG